MTIHHKDPSSADQHQIPEVRTLWDRKADGGFPETKELKRRVRDVIEPGRDLGHVDRDHAKEKEAKKEASNAAGQEESEQTKRDGQKGEEKCEDCAT